jgi:cytochrome c biogenesis protein CcmG/thiol:disulfide interchange protein DsbE
MRDKNFMVAGLAMVVFVMLAAAGWANWMNRRHIAEMQSQRAMEPMAMGNMAGMGAGGDGAGEMTSPMVGKMAANFTLTDVNGKKVSLSDFKGKAVQLNFWATWCAPCKIETPWLVELEKQYKAKGFEILGVSFDDLDMDDAAKLKSETADIAKSANQLGINYPVLLDGDAISKQYGDPEVFPTSFFVNRQGKIVAATIGLTSKDDLENDIKKALGTGE